MISSCRGPVAIHGDFAGGDVVAARVVGVVKAAVTVVVAVEGITDGVAVFDFAAQPVRFNPNSEIAGIAPASGVAGRAPRVPHWAPALALPDPQFSQFLISTPAARTKSIRRCRCVGRSSDNPDIIELSWPNRVAESLAQSSPTLSPSRSPPANGTGSARRGCRCRRGEQDAPARRLSRRAQRRRL